MWGTDVEADGLLLFATQMAPIHRLIIIVSSLMGFVMVGSGIFYAGTGGGRGAMQGHGVGMGLSMTLAGVALLNITPFLSMSMMSLLGESNAPSPLAVIQGDPQSVWVKSVFNILIVAGWIFVVWGLSSLGIAGSRRERGLGAGISRIVAGTFLANPYLAAMFIGASFGISDVVTVVIPPPP